MHWSPVIYLGGTGEGTHGKRSPILKGTCRVDRIRMDTPLHQVLLAQANPGPSHKALLPTQCDT